MRPRPPEIPNPVRILAAVEMVVEAVVEEEREVAAVAAALYNWVNYGKGGGRGGLCLEMVFEIL